MHRLLVAVAALAAAGLAGPALADGGEGAQVKARHEAPSEVKPLRFYQVAKGDPLTASTMDSPGSAETPYLAPSTGRWNEPGEILPPPRIDHDREIGSFKDD